MRFSLASIAVAASFLSLGGFVATPASAQSLYNPCPYTNDGDCDEPNGLNLCAWGTDANDCSNPNSYHGSGPGYFAGAYANNGGGGGSGNLSQGVTVQPQPQPQAAACPYTNDGDCDEPNGLNLCPWGSDAVDCSNPNSNYGSGPGFAAGRYTAVTPPTPSTGYSTGTFINSGAGGSYGCPNYATNSTAFGEGTLQAGGAVSPVRIPRITAGGRHALANCFPGTGWRGYTITRPDYRFFYQGYSPTGRLTFSLISDATDTVLLINTPDGQWHFNDDSNGSYNSTLTFTPPLQGQYDIWAGSYNLSSNNPAQLWISE